MLYTLNKCLFFMTSRWMRNLLYSCILVYLTFCFISIDPFVVKKTLRSVRDSRNSSLLLRIEPAEHQNFTCIWSAIEERQKCKPVCGPGFFGLYGMKRCHRLLDCVDIKQLKEKQDIGNSGYVKEVWQSHWKSFPVVVKNLRVSDLAGRIAAPGYYRGIQLMRDFYKPSVLLQLVGHCNDTIVTELYPMLDARDLEKRLQEYPLYNNLKTRMQLCISFVDILRALHSGYDGKIYVQCDAGNLRKLAGQFLLTEDFHLVLSDVDSMEAIGLNGKTRKLIKCTVWGEMKGYFPAPEQLWPYKGHFNASKMPLYDEKVEIWKIPNVCLYFLGDDASSLKLKQSLKPIHKRCKNLNPRKRPSAEEVHKAYVTIYHDLINGTNVSPSSNAKTMS